MSGQVHKSPGPHPHKAHPADAPIWESSRKENTYERIGLYVHTKHDGAFNFADVHLRWNSQVAGPKNKRTYYADFVDAWYSGPLSSVDMVTVFRRPQAAYDYQAHNRAAHEFDIENGGDALVAEKGNFVGLELSTQFTQQPAHVWLFGPLNFLGHAYGSLMFTLKGKFAPGRGFQPLEVRGSRYSGGIVDFPAPRVSYTLQELAEIYADRVKQTFSVPLPPTADRWEWRIEAFHKHLTGSQVGKQQDRHSRKNSGELGIRFPGTGRRNEGR